MAGGFASFMVGMGTGYLNGREKAKAEERQAKEDEWRDEQRKWQREQHMETQGDKQAIKDATANRVTMQGTAVTDGAGNANLYQDPAQAAAAADEARIEAEMRGQSTANVTATPATGVTGTMSKGHQITAAPMDVAALNTREAKLGRVANALMERGKPLEAMSMENSVLDNQAKKLGFKREELKFADEMTRRTMSDALREGKTWYEGAAKFVTDTQMGGLQGVKAEPVVSPDGKTVTLFAVMPDGTRQDRGSYPTDDSGATQFMEKFGALPLETRMNLMQERAKTAYQKSRDAKADENWEKTFDFNKKKEENDQQYRNRMLSFQGAQEARARQTHALAMEDARIPAAVKLQAQSLAKQMETVNTAVSKAMAENSFDPNSANAKALLEQQATLGLRYTELLKPFSPAGKGAPGAGLPDASVFGTAPAGGAAAPGTPAPAGGALPNANGAAGVPVRPGAPVATVAPMQAATAPAAPVAPQAAPRMTLAQVLAGPSADPTLQKLAGDRAQQIEGAANELRQAQAGVAAAAQRGDQKAVAAAMQAASAAGARLNAFTKDMNDQQAAQVRAALGI